MVQLHLLGRRLLLAATTTTAKPSSCYYQKVIGSVRCLATRRKMNATPVSSEVLDNLPYYPETDDPPSQEPGAYVRTPVKSAHCVDLDKVTVSDLDCVSISPSASFATRHGPRPSAAGRA